MLCVPALLTADGAVSGPYRDALGTGALKTSPPRADQTSKAMEPLSPSLCVVTAFLRWQRGGPPPRGPVSSPWKESHERAPPTAQLGDRAAHAVAGERSAGTKPLPGARHQDARHREEAITAADRGAAARQGRTGSTHGGLSSGGWGWGRARPDQGGSFAISLEGRLHTESQAGAFGQRSVPEAQSLDSSSGKLESRKIPAR